ncbi:MAG: NAD-dependent epimerase/dehydratase family protein [Nitrososphaerales archaeon]
MGKIAVTGGAGFLGSHLAKGLLERGHELVIIDNLSAGSMANLRDLGIKKDCLVGDLREYSFAKDALRDVETVWHFAAEVGSVVYLHGSSASELGALQSNLAIDANVFRSCLENGIKRVIYASSVSVYPFDEQQGSPIAFKEEDSQRKINPEGGYGWSKFIGEKQISLMPGIDYGVARIFHAYGENIYLREDRSQVIGSLIRKAVRYPKEDFVVWGNGTQRRCFVFISDVLEALFKLEEHVKGGRNLTVNVGSTEETTVEKLAQRVIELSGKEIEMKFDATKPSGALSRTPDLSFVKKELGWEPKTGFSEGLERTYRWACKRLSNT